MDDMDLHRKERLKLAIAGAPFHGRREKFIADSGLSKGRISQLLDPAIPFGERSAIKLARKLAEKHAQFSDDRYFDRPIDEPGASSQSGGQRTGAPDLDPNVMQHLPTMAATVLHLGALLGSLDARTRRGIGDYLADLATHPDEASDIAEKIAALAATKQASITQNAMIKEALRRRDTNPVETDRAPLGDK